MRKWRVVLLLAALAAAPGPVRADEEGVVDVITGALPLGTLWLTHHKDDKEGRKQFLYSTLVSYGINGAIRFATKDGLGKRPNGHEYGFPSGHIGFLGAASAFLRERYGWSYALPAYALQGYAAHVRVDTEHHYWRDIAAAVVIAEGVAMLMVDPYEDKEAVVLPVITSEGEVRVVWLQRW